MTASNILTTRVYATGYVRYPAIVSRSIHQFDVMASCLPAPAHQCGGQDCPAHEPTETELTSGTQRVSLFVCELRHITLPGIDLVCRRFLPKLGPVANGGFLLSGAGLLNSLSETHDQGRL